MADKAQTLYIVIPCYNEEAVLKDTASQLLCKVNDLIENGKVSGESRILFVNDGSSDSTWDIIEGLCETEELVNGISLAHNAGHQNALLAGLMAAKELADMVVSMDADLQDDIDAIDKMVDKYYEGNDIVYGVRSERKKDTVFKRTTARAFYRFMRLLGANIVEDHADFRLMSKKALEDLAKFKEVNLFLRGIVPMLSHKCAKVYYERGERKAGESKYPLKKMLSFAWQGITSFSMTPIKFITFLGAAFSIFSLIMMIYSFIRYFRGETIAGWPSLIVSLWMIGGVILLSIGVIGEYIGKIYLETKARPRFLIDKEMLDDKEDSNEDQ